MRNAMLCRRSTAEPRMYRLIGALLLLATSLLAAPPPVSKPESVGMSAQRLSRIGRWLDGIIERKEAAGFVTIVARRGKVVHHEARGTRGLAVSDPMPLEAIFDVASMTKPITVVAALMLLEEGAFTLEDPISDYLPEFKNPKVQVGPQSFEPAKREITVRHLLTHTSGIGDPRPRVNRFAFPTLEEYAKDAAKLPLLAQPGSKFLYGDSHDVLGYLVQKVSGKPLDQFVEERILEPLEMSDTHYWPPASKDSRRAVIGRNGKDVLAAGFRWPPEAAEAKTFIGGAGGIYSTAADYWRFCQMLLNGGAVDGRRLLGSRTVSLIRNNHDPLGLFGQSRLVRPGRSFGLGFAVVSDQRDYLSKGSYSWGGGLGTTFWIDPAEELTAVLMVQARPSRQMRLHEKFSALVYSSIVD